FFIKNIDIDVIVSKLEFIDFCTGQFIKSNEIYSSDLIRDYFTGRVSFYVSGPLWNRKFLNKQDELFDPLISNLDDWDFNLRMIYKNPKIIFDNSLVVKYRIHQNSLSSKISKLDFLELKSDYFARQKNLKFIKFESNKDYIFLKQYSKNWCKYLVRDLVSNKKKHQFFFLIKLYKMQFELKEFSEIFRFTFGYISTNVFNKGYKFLK
ncbi:MAG: hypothetical protein H7174_07940, partial [Flavobacterium sp.]|nr:hypothetical protein [Flavobacterium sp.]